MAAQTTAAAKVQEEPAPHEAIPGKLYVKDTNCNDRYPKRIHRMEGPKGTDVPITFIVDEYTLLDEATGRKFLVDPSFIVCDRPIEEGGTRIFSVPKEKSDDGRIKLAENETVARFDELSQVALLNRAAILTGSGKFNTSTKRTALIDFLIANRQKTAKAAVPESGAQVVDAALDGGTMSQSELKQMFPDD